MTDYQVGDIVEITRTGLQYSLYVEWLAGPGDEDLRDRFRTHEDASLADGMTAHVVKVAPHNVHAPEIILLGVERKNRVYIIGSAGVKLIHRSNPTEHPDAAPEGEMISTLYVLLDGAQRLRYNLQQSMRELDTHIANIRTTLEEK